MWDNNVFWYLCCLSKGALAQLSIKVLHSCPKPAHELIIRCCTHTSPDGQHSVLRIKKTCCFAKPGAVEHTQKPEAFLLHGISYGIAVQLEEGRAEWNNALMDRKCKLNRWEYKETNLKITGCCKYPSLRKKIDTEQPFISVKK